jgi:hypothetical protein
MPKLKKEIFSRAVRFQHRFGDGDDPHVMGGGEYFDFKGPKLPKSDNMPSQRLNIKEHGLRVWTEALSPVTKAKGGKASINGPQLDVADMLTEEIPAGTRKRGPRGVI